jgi:lipopolysaccharide heptosyltransferase II
LKILILKPSSLGDVVQALPVLRLLRRHLPQSAIYWWIDSNLAPLLEGDPDLTGLVEFERRGWSRARWWIGLGHHLRWLRGQRFDWVIDLQSLARSGAIAWLARGDLTIGLDESREGARGFYDVIVRRPSFHTHAVDWYLSVLPWLGVPVHRDFQWLPPRPLVLGQVNEKWPGNQKRWVAVQPGARWLNKRWPAESFAEVLQSLAQADADLQFVILGSSDDCPLAKIIADKSPPGRSLDLTGKSTLLEMVEWIRLSELIITNDTGPMHVAAALGKPVVALFGPTEPRRTGPYGQLSNVLQLDLPCVPCLRARCHYTRPLECLRALPPSAVIRAARQALRLNAQPYEPLGRAERPA